ncbi:hypothetical protein [Paenibacillus hexagrammi]|uniref:Uncharacterized protein n=1 Tax=Paenibacillus hexagrammi TaxID=2908839 RepID=A0ABY3SHU7_9BACL|nr:hypothetical protein [Paenibacillus sp. YPD9-1]UJF33599.1 hypothetical protein L0M14_29630 [Paenibacillus sp. YPD9-1]
MKIWSLFLIQLLEAIFILAIGYMLTDYVLKPMYVNYGITFIGNVWVNWVSVSYFVFFLYTVVRAWLGLRRNLAYFTKRITSVLFTVLFFCSVYVMIIPFVKGYNPF